MSRVNWGNTRSPFPDGVSSRVASPFALLHFEIWALSRIVSSLGSRYFVAFIDNYSRCTWIFLMTNRSEVFSFFKIFYQEIKT